MTAKSRWGEREGKKKNSQHPRYLKQKRQSPWKAGKQVYALMSHSSFSQGGEEEVQKFGHHSTELDGHDEKKLQNQLTIKCVFGWLQCSCCCFSLPLSHIFLNHVHVWLLLGFVETAWSRASLFISVLRCCLDKFSTVPLAAAPEHKSFSLCHFDQPPFLSSSVQEECERAGGGWGDRRRWKRGGRTAHITSHWLGPFGGLNMNPIIRSCLSTLFPSNWLSHID